MSKLIKGFRRIVSLPWLLTFLVIMIFFTFIAAPGNQIAARDSAGRLYIQYFDDCNGNQGLLPNISDGIVASITGPTERTVTSTCATANMQGGQGAIYQLGSITSDFYTYPSSSAIIWAQDQYQQIIGGKSFIANAQVAGDPNQQSFYFPGLGYQILTPVSQFWQWSRNLVYAFFIIILIVIAFLTLFRNNLGGQEAVTLANSLPSIIISLILVTLSYPICGFFIDVIYLGSGFVQSVMLTAPGAPGRDLIYDHDTGAPLKLKYLQEAGGGGGVTEADAANILQPDDPQMSVWNFLSTSGANLCGNTATCTLGNLVPDALKTTNSGNTNIFGAVLNIVVSGSGNNGIFNVGSLLGLVLSVGAFTVAFRLFMVILQNYILLSFYPILAPWVFLGAAIPSRTASVIEGFIRSLLGASLTFIAIYAVMLFIVIVGHSGDLPANSAFLNAGQLTWAPPLAGYSSAQLGAENHGAVLRAIVAFGLFMSLPSIPELIQNLLKVPSSPDIIKQTGERASATAKQTAGGAAGVFGKLTSNFFKGG